MTLVKFAKECKEKKLRSFSSYKTKKELNEVLRKYGIDSNEITKIPPFEPEPVEIDDEDEELEQCITEIKRRMGIIGSATGRNEAVRCEYISPILYASIYIAKRITKKGITMDPQFEVIGEEASGRVDYAIKKVIDINIMQLESSYHTNTRKRKASVAFDDEFDYFYGIVTTGRDFQIYCSKDDYHIALNEKIMKDDAELRRGVKKVMGVIVGLLKDRVEVDDSRIVREQG
ncbi:hypothetical protein C1646_715275 [Rhizophagus diaphanus]|nr:hypothetical protein C1646_715275 [Rhizophagus diaphanus] [Rhizophagus sp. MUCL 43196]